MTGKIAAKADRGADPFEYIDDTRQEVVEINEWRDFTEKRLKILEDAERDRLTETGVWDFLQAKMNKIAVKRAVRLGSKFIHWVIGVVGVGVLYLLVLLFKLAWKGLTT